MTTTRSMIVGLLLLGTAVATGIAVAAFGFGSAGTRSALVYGPPSPLPTATPIPCSAVTVDNSRGNSVVTGTVLAPGCSTRLKIENKTKLWAEVTLSESPAVMIAPFGGLSNIPATIGVIPPSVILLNSVFGSSGWVYNASFPDGNHRFASFLVDTTSLKAFEFTIVDLVASSLLKADAATFAAALLTSNSVTNDLGGQAHLQASYSILHGCISGNSVSIGCVRGAIGELRLSFTSPEEQSRWIQLFANLGKDVTVQGLLRLSPISVLLKWAGLFKSSLFEQPAGSVQFTSR